MISKEVKGLSPVVLSNGYVISGMVSYEMIRLIQAYILWNVVPIKGAI